MPPEQASSGSKLALMQNLPGVPVRTSIASGAHGAGASEISRRRKKRKSGMWSVKFKWLYAIFLVAFTLVIGAAFLKSVLASTKSHISPLVVVFAWVVVFGGI
jgi:hypothetical protein